MELLLNFEFYILKFFSHLHTPFTDNIMVFISSTGNSGMIWIVFALVLMCFKKYRKCAMAMLLSLFLCLVLGNIILKPLIARTRPFNIDTTISLLISAPADYSFPSGHTLSSFATASASMYSKNKYIYVLSFVYASLIAFSRLYLQVHFITDVVGGIILGLILGYVSIKIIQKSTL